MNETPSEPHPLDAVDDMDAAELPRRKAFEGTRAYKPLLLACAAYVAILTSLRRNMAITPPIIVAREVRPGDSA